MTRHVALKMMGLTIGLLIVAMQGCVSQPKVTRVIYEDRSVWVRLEHDSALEKPEPSAAAVVNPASLNSAMLSAWMRGFRVETDRGPIGMLIGKSGDANAFVEAEISALTPHMAKGLKAAGPDERVAYCMAVDYSSNERFITTGWIYAHPPFLYFKITEYRTPVKVTSPAIPTAQACLTKPVPGTKTADRFFRLDYQPSDAVVRHGLTAGLMSGADRNPRGEVVFKLSYLYSMQPADRKTEQVGTKESNAKPAP